MLQDSLLYHPLEVVIWVSSIAMNSDNEVELFVRELLGKGGAYDEKNLLHIRLLRGWECSAACWGRSGGWRHGSNKCRICRVPR